MLLCLRRCSCTDAGALVLAPVLMFWRRCEKEGETCAIAERRMVFCGAGPRQIIGPAPLNANLPRSLFFFPACLPCTFPPVSLRKAIFVERSRGDSSFQTSLPCTFPPVLPWRAIFVERFLGDSSFQASLPCTFPPVPLWRLIFVERSGTG